MYREVPKRSLIVQSCLEWRLFFLPVDRVSGESVLVIQHAPDTSKKQGFGAIGVSFAVANKQKI